MLRSLAISHVIKLISHLWREKQLTKHPTPPSEMTPVWCDTWKCRALNRWYRRFYDNQATCDWWRGIVSIATPSATRNTSSEHHSLNYELLILYQRVRCFRPDFVHYLLCPFSHIITFTLLRTNYGIVKSSSLF